MTAAPFAHAQWFVDQQRDFAVEWSSFTSASTLAAIATAALVVAAVVVAAPSLPRPLLMPVARLRPAAGRAPALIAVTLGLGLIGMSALGYVWMRPAPSDEIGTVLVALQVQIGIWLLLGVARAAAASAVIALTALVVVAVDPVAVLAAAYIPAAAVALLGFARGGRSARSAEAALRTGMGVALIAAALAEKLVAPTITILVLEAHPELDLLGAGPETFTLLAGSVELLLGGLLLVGVASQLAALATLGPLVATVPLFGATELVGHLPIYGVLLAIAVLAPAVGRAAPSEAVP